MYYRVAMRHETSPAWQWKSTNISSLTALFQFLRRYEKISQDSLRVFSSCSIEEMDDQLARENNGIGSCSVTAEQFRREHLMGAQPATLVSAAPSSNMSSNGSYPASRAVTVGAASQTVKRGDFWNLMTLVQ